MKPDVPSYHRYPLDGGFERVRRAEKHLGDLKARIDWAFAQQANSIPLEFDPNPPYRDIRPTGGPVETFFGMEVAILIGEMCYNLRNALDYLVFEFAILDSGSEKDKTQFPIESKPEGFKGRRNTYLNGVNDAHVVAIERLQPYNGCKWTALLRDVSNPDKHRHLVGTEGNYTGQVYSSLTSDLSRVRGYERTEMHPVHGPVQVKVHLTGAVTFPNGPPVIEALQEIKACVTETLTNFKPEFQ